MKNWFTVSEGAEYAGVSRDAINTACELRELHYARIGGRRSIRIKPQWIDAWLERHGQTATGTLADARGEAANERAGADPCQVVGGL